MSGSESNQPFDIEGLGARWLRLHQWRMPPPPIGKIFNVPLSKDNWIAPSLGYPLPKPFETRKYWKMPPNAKPIHYEGESKCIYCGTREYYPGATRRLGEEHIIAGGLGASMILFRASCQEHERQTSRIETKLFQMVFDPLRKKFDIRGNNRRSLRKNKFSVTHMVGGKDITLALPIADHPTMLYLTQLGPPGILTGRPKWLHGIVGSWYINLNATKEKLAKHGLKNFDTPPLDTVLFSQMLCKIAHTLATAEVLAENFEPLLLDFLLHKHDLMDEDDRRHYFVGGTTFPEPPTPYLHELGIRLYGAHGKLFLIVRIRLFAFLGAPAYLVVAGIVPESKRAAVNARLSDDNSRTQAL